MLPIRKIFPLLLSLFFVTSFAARAAVYYVDGTNGSNSNNGTSWATAKKDVQEAINVATSAGDEVWVKAGTYLPTLDANGSASPADNRDKVFYLTTKDIQLYGGFAGTETAISQRTGTAANTTILNGNNNAYHVLVTINRTSACIVDGFTMSGGRSTGSGPFNVTTSGTDVYRSDGGAVVNTGSSLQISNCVIRNNSSAFFGGGIYNSGSSPTISSCTFSSNTAGAQGGGMANNYGSSPVVTNCTFSTNTAMNVGGGVYNEGSNPTVSSCTFSRNRANFGGGCIISVAAVLR